MTDQIEKDAAAEAEAAAAAAEEQEAKTAADSAPEQELADPTEEDLSLLSAEERALLDADRKADEDADAAAKAAEEAAAQPAEPEPKEEEPAPPPAPEIPDTSEAERLARELADQRKGLLDKYEEGEITREDFRKQDEALSDQLVDARAQIRSADAVRAQAKAAEDAIWYAAVDEHTKAFPDLVSPEHLPGFDATLKSVTAAPGYAHLTFKQQIETAHRLYGVHAETIGKPIPLPGAKAEPAPAAKEPEKLEVRKDARPETPTLASLPQSDPGGSNEGRFAGMDRLIDSDDPHAAEAAYERMSPEEQARFLNGA